MPMKPNAGESQSDFMSRCVPEMVGDDKRPKDQAVAACSTIWSEAHGKQFSDLDVPYPDDDEGQEEFIDRCVEEVLDENEEASRTDAEEACAISWEERGTRVPRQRAMGYVATDNVLRKTHAGTVSDMEFILSDETPDRMGDVILADGWDLTNFKKNPIALFNHRPDFPIGTWSKLRVEDGKLRGKLILAPEGTSPRIDEIRRLIEADILRASSVGFKPISATARRNGQGEYVGETFTRSELVETSVVSVPANPNALAVAKSLKISDRNARPRLCQARQQRTHGSAVSRCQRQARRNALHSKDQ